jgi:Ca-activated chloride channel homolog
MNRPLLVLAALLWSVASFSQNPLSAAQNGLEVQSASRTVLLTIETASRAPLNNTDVLASVNKQPFAPVLQLLGASSAPLDLVLVVDTSTSATRSKLLNPALNGAVRFVAAVRSSGIAVRTALVEFNARVRVVQNFTSDPLENSLKELSPGGASAMYDALASAARLAQESAPSTRRIILVVTDGEDNLSHTTRDEVVKAAGRASASIYAIALGEPPSQYAPLTGRGEKILKEMSTQTGGRAFFPKNETKIGEVFDAIQSELPMQFFAMIAVPAIKKGVYPLQFKTLQGSIRGATTVVFD